MTATDTTSHHPLQLLTVQDVCALWGVKDSWVYDQVEAGRLRAVKLGSRLLRFRLADLAAYTESAR